MDFFTKICVIRSIEGKNNYLRISASFTIINIGEHKFHLIIRKIITVG